MHKAKLIPANNVKVKGETQRHKNRVKHEQTFLCVGVSAGRVQINGGL